MLRRRRSDPPDAPQFAARLCGFWLRGSSIVGFQFTGHVAVRRFQWRTGNHGPRRRFIGAWRALQTLDRQWPCERGSWSPARSNRRCLAYLSCRRPRFGMPLRNPIVRS